jgi:putative acyl-CoA dehydrogenase
MPPPYRPRNALETHEVENQPAERGDVDLWSTDRPLTEAVSREGGADRAADLAAFGAEAGRAERREEGRLANRYPPELRVFDRSGRRIDEPIA